MSYDFIARHIVTNIPYKLEIHEYIHDNTNDSTVNFWLTHTELNLAILMILSQVNIIMLDYARIQSTIDFPLVKSAAGSVPMVQDMDHIMNVSENTNRR